MKVTNLQINHMSTAIGIDGSKLRITWTLEGGKKQSAYQVTVESQKGDILYDSSRIEGNQTYHALPVQIPYKTAGAVRVTVWDENNTASDPAEISFVTGISKDDWKASWMNPELEGAEIETRRGAYLKKTFILDASQIGESSYIYATCHGLMNIYVNGQEASENQLMPGTQQYDKRLLVETIDVTDLLKAGENEIVVSLGDGWYRGSMANDQHRNVYGSDIALLLQLEIAGSPVVITDDSWQATSDGPIGRNDFMIGEEYDATKEDLPGMHTVKVEDFGYDNLICRDTVPVTCHETFQAKYIEVPNGEKVLDFGQNLVGFVSFTIDATAGQKIKLSHGEVLDGSGNFTTQNFQSRRTPCSQDVIYTCKDGENVYHATKTYMGFRYVKVEADMDIPADAFTAVAIYSDMRQTGFFECGVADVNQLFQNAIWSMKGNFVDVPTDCPTREKSGYSGDLQAYVDTAMYLMDSYAVCAKWIREQATGQYEDGVVPQICPKPTAPGEKQMMMGVLQLDGGIGWSDAFEIVPYKMWKRDGDTSLIEENYEGIKRWTEYEINRAKKTRDCNLELLPEEHREYMIDNEFMWGEWLEPGQTDAYMGDMVRKGDPEVGTAFFYTNLTYMAKFAELLGHDEDKARYEELAEKARDAYHAVYLKDGKIKEEHRQCRYVRPIAHDLLTDEEKKRAAADLAEMVHANNDHLNTGFLTTHDLPRALSDNGQKTTAYNLLLQREMPGWLYAVTQGCTTIPERWDIYNAEGNPMESFNHYSYGAVAGWLLDSACGIRVEEGEITIAPKCDERLGYANGTYESPLGTIVSNWKYEDGQVHYHIEVPANNVAKIELEGAEPIIKESGSYDFVV